MPPRVLKKPCKHCGLKHRQTPTPKEERWCQEYVVDLNGGRATSVAYPRAAKHNQTKIAYGLLQRPHVVCMLGQLKRDQAVRSQMTADQVLADITAVARFDLGVLFDEDDKIRPISEWPEWARRVVSQFQTGSDGTKVKVPDRLRAMEMIGRHHKLFTDVLQVGGELTLRERMARGRRAAREQEE